MEVVLEYYNPDEDDDCFSIESIPGEIQQLVVEKFVYEEFATFNECSELSADICDALPSSRNLAVLMEDIYIAEDGEFARYKNGKQLDFSRFPPKLRVHCDRLHINSEHNLGRIEEFKITTDYLYYHARNRDASIVGKLITATKPTSFQSLPSKKAITILDEVCQLPELDLPSDFETDDETLFKLKCTKMQILGNLKITLEGIAKFFEQWCKYEREIHEIDLSVENDRWLVDLPPKLPVECVTEIGEPTTDGYILLLCRSEKHDDCIKIRQETCMVTQWIVWKDRCPNFKEQ